MLTSPIPARPTTYKGVQMRSRLEAKAAQMYDAAGLVWTYEPQCFASESGQYLPDFRIGESAYFEVKPFAYFAEPLNFYVLSEVQHRMEIILESEPSASLAIHCPDKPRGIDPIVAAFTGQTFLYHSEVRRFWMVHREILPQFACLPLPSGLETAADIAGGFRLGEFA
jgi:hypothetical protein